MQAGPSMMSSSGGGDPGGGMEDDRILGNSGGPAKSTEMPAIAMTSLCEIKFNRKDVKHMNVLMCRRLVAALYQVRVENNRMDDKEARFRQRFADFVPDQFVVLYGIKSLAIKNIKLAFGFHRKTVNRIGQFFWRISIEMAKAATKIRRASHLPEKP